MLQHNQSMQLSIELLDTENESPDERDDTDASEHVKWTNYVDNFVNNANDAAPPMKQPKEEPTSHLTQGYNRLGNPHHQHHISPVGSAGDDLNPLASEGQLLALIGCGGIKADLSEDLKEHLKKKPVFLSRNIRQWKSRVRRRRDASGNLIALGSTEAASGRDTSKKPGMTTNKTIGLNSSSGVSLSGVTTNAAKTLSSSLSANPASSGNPPPSGISPTSSGNFSLSDLTVTDDIECKFTLGNFKMLYVVNSESYLYKHSSLLKAKKVSLFRILLQEFC